MPAPSPQELNSDDPIVRINAFMAMIRARPSDGGKRYWLRHAIFHMRKHFLAPGDLGMTEQLIRDMCAALELDYDHFIDVCDRLIQRKRQQVA